jgi:hypothetical protein
MCFCCILFPYCLGNHHDYVHCFLFANIGGGVVISYSISSPLFSADVLIDGRKEGVCCVLYFFCRCTFVDYVVARGLFPAEAGECQVVYSDHFEFLLPVSPSDFPYFLSNWHFV